MHYRVLNTSWTPLYVADNIYLTTPEVMARWSPYMFGAGRSPQPFAYGKKFDSKKYRGKVLGGQCRIGHHLIEQTNFVPPSNQWFLISKSSGILGQESSLRQIITYKWRKVV